jgi:glycosyltransferase involved in cell wall biosynthesis
MNDLYEADIAAWAEQQADALRRRAANEIDWENVAEEIESLARSDRRESAIASPSSANIS